MRTATTTSEQPLTRKELALWIEQYQDGTIEEASARKLGALIHNRDAEAAWVIEELEFAGLLAQALHDVDQESFLRAFVERLSAEKGDERVTSRDIAASATAQIQAARAQSKPGAGQHLATMVAGMASQFSPASSSDGKRRLHPMRVTGLILVLSAVTASAAWVFLVPDSVGRLADYTPGVVLIRGNTRLLPESGMRIRVGDALMVPRGGKASARFMGRSELTVEDDASVNFRLGTAEKDDPVIQLVRGKLLVASMQSNKAQTRLHTPHAQVTLSDGESSLAVTASTTRIENQSAAANIVRRSDAAVLEVPPEHHAIIGPGAPLRFVAN